MNQQVTFLRQITIIHLGLLIGQVIFAVITFIHHKENWHYDFSFSEPIVIVPIIASAVAFFLHKKIYTKILEQTKTKNTLTEKLVDFQKATIVNFAIIEGASLLSIALAFITQNIYLLFLAGVLILYFIGLKPTKEKISNDLTLNREEKEELNKMS